MTYSVSLASNCSRDPGQNAPYKSLCFRNLNFPCPSIKWLTAIFLWQRGHTLFSNLYPLHPPVCLPPISAPHVLSSWVPSRTAPAVMGIPHPAGGLTLAIPSFERCNRSFWSVVSPRSLDPAPIRYGDPGPAISERNDLGPPSLANRLFHR